MRISGLLEAAAASPKALHHQGFNSPGWILLHDLPPIVLEIYDCTLTVQVLACGGTTSRLYIHRESRSSETVKSESRRYVCDIVCCPLQMTSSGGSLHRRRAGPRAGPPNQAIQCNAGAM